MFFHELDTPHCETHRTDTVHGGGCATLLDVAWDGSAGLEAPVGLFADHVTDYFGCVGLGRFFVSVTMLESQNR